MIEQVVIPVAVALLAKLGEKVINKFWDEASAGKKPIVKQDGSVGMASTHNGRTLVRNEYTSTKSGNWPSHITGNIYIPTSIQELLTGEEIALGAIAESW